MSLYEGQVRKGGEVSLYEGQVREGRGSKPVRGTGEGGEGR